MSGRDFSEVCSNEIGYAIVIKGSKVNSEEERHSREIDEIYNKFLNRTMSNMYDMSSSSDIIPYVMQYR